MVFPVALDFYILYMRIEVFKVLKTGLWSSGLCSSVALLVVTSVLENPVDRGDMLICAHLCSLVTTCKTAQLRNLEDHNEKM